MGPHAGAYRARVGRGAERVRTEGGWGQGTASVVATTSGETATARCRRVPGESSGLSGHVNGNKGQQPLIGMRKIPRHADQNSFLNSFFNGRKQFFIFEDFHNVLIR